MSTLTPTEIQALLRPYTSAPLALSTQLATYLDLLLKWNARTNLTAIRSPEEIVRRHFGESLFAAQHLPPDTQTLLDLGSGAGFPGLPIALLHPRIRVTLAESQNKKATFLREVIRTLGLSAEVWASRAETLPATRHFDTVTLRAVDNMAAALNAAAHRATRHILLLTSAGTAPPPDFHSAQTLPIPNSTACVLQTLTRTPETAYHGQKGKTEKDG